MKKNDVIKAYQNLTKDSPFEFGFFQKICSGESYGATVVYESLEGRFFEVAVSRVEASSWRDLFFCIYGVDLKELGYPNAIIVKDQRTHPNGFVEHFKFDDCMRITIAKPEHDHIKKLSKAQNFQGYVQETTFSPRFLYLRPLTEDERAEFVSA